MTCYSCGRPIQPGKYLAFTHSAGIPRSWPAHYARPSRKEKPAPPATLEHALLDAAGWTFERYDRGMPKYQAPRPAHHASVAGLGAGDTDSVGGLTEASDAPPCSPTSRPAAVNGHRAASTANPVRGTSR
jgi:hypothetical protein